MAVEHTARTGADRGYNIIVPEDATATMNAEWQTASIDFALQNVATITTTKKLLKKLETNDMTTKITNVAAITGGAQGIGLACAKI